MSKGWDKDNGNYTMIANAILDGLAQMKLSGRDRRVLDVIFRRTYGFHEKEMPVYGEFIAQKTRIHKSDVSRSFNRLLKLGLIYTRNKKLSKRQLSKLSKRQLVVGELATDEIGKPVQVVGINKSAFNISKMRKVGEVATIKEIVINNFKESAEKGGFTTALSAWLKEKEGSMPIDENDKFLIQGLKAIDKIYPPGISGWLESRGRQFKSELDKLEKLVNSFSGKELTADQVDSKFAEAVNDYYRAWKSAIAAFKKVGQT